MTTQSDLGTGQHLVGKNLGAVSDTEKGAASANKSVEAVVGLAHTPGPWTTDGLRISARYHASYQSDDIGRPVVIASTHYRSNGLQIGSYEAKRNAALIAAAPDMLAVLREAETYFDNYADVLDGAYGEPMPNEAMRMLTEIRAAIAKAEGRS